MRDPIQFLLAHGYSLVAVVVFAEQVGLPVSAVPVFLAIGSLVTSGHFSVAGAISVAATAALAGDLIWFALGRRKGRAVLKVLCRLSLEPDSCVRRTESSYRRLGAAALIVSKFVPGLSTAAPPLAGMTGMSTGVFVECSLAGAALWAGVYMGVGWLFRDEFERIWSLAERMGAGFSVVLVTVLGLYVAVKAGLRYRFRWRMRTSRVKPHELREWMDSGKPVAIVDLRHPSESQTSRIPGAISIDVSDIDARLGEIPRDRDVILYCN